MELLTVVQVASLLNVSKSLVYRLKDEGQIPCFKVGRSAIRFNREDVDAYLSSCRDRKEQRKGEKKRESTSGPFTHLDGDRLLAEWRRRGVHIDRQDGRNTPTSE